MLRSPLLAAVLAVAVAGAYAGSASGAVLEYTSLGFTYTAGAGEANRLQVSLGRGTAVVRDGGASIAVRAAAGLPAGGSCTQSSGSEVSCQFPSPIVATVALGDMDDTAYVGGTLSWRVFVRGGNGPDTLLADPALGGVTFEGEAGDDRVAGSAGGDELSGGTGNDVLRGGSGYDTLDPGTGRDDIGGGLGGNRVLYNRRSTRVTVILDGRANDGSARGTRPCAP